MGGCANAGYAVPTGTNSYPLASLFRGHAVSPEPRR